MVGELLPQAVPCWSIPPSHCIKAPCSRIQPIHGAAACRSGRKGVKAVSQLAAPADSPPGYLSRPRRPRGTAVLTPVEDHVSLQELLLVQQQADAGHDPPPPQQQQQLVPLQHEQYVEQTAQQAAVQDQQHQQLLEQQQAQQQQQNMLAGLLTVVQEQQQQALQPPAQGPWLQHVPANSVVPLPAVQQHGQQQQQRRRLVQQQLQRSVRPPPPQQQQQQKEEEQQQQQQQQRQRQQRQLQLQSQHQQLWQHNGHDQQQHFPQQQQQQQHSQQQQHAHYLGQQGQQQESRQLQQQQRPQHPGPQQQQQGLHSSSRAISAGNSNGRSSSSSKAAAGVSAYTVVPVARAPAVTQASAAAAAAAVAAAAAAAARAPKGKQGRSSSSTAAAAAGDAGGQASVSLPPAEQCVPQALWGLMNEELRPWHKQVLVHLCYVLPPPASHIYRGMRPNRMQRVLAQRAMLEKELRSHLTELVFHQQQLRGWLNMLQCRQPRVDKTLNPDGVRQLQQQLLNLKAALGRSRYALHVLQDKAAAYSDRDYVQYSQGFEDLISEMEGLADLQRLQVAPLVLQLQGVQEAAARQVLFARTADAVAALNRGAAARMQQLLQQQQEALDGSKQQLEQLKASMRGFAWRYPSPEYVAWRFKGVPRGSKSPWGRTPGVTRKGPKARQGVQQLQQPGLPPPLLES